MPVKDRLLKRTIVNVRVAFLSSNEKLVLRKREKIMNNGEKYKDCLSCSNSHSDECDILHCMERNGQVVEEDEYCEKWN